MRSWLQATLIRVVRTGAQAALGVIGAAAVFSEIKWDVVGGATALAMLISFLMALAGLPETPDPAPLAHLKGDDAGQVQAWVPLVLVFVVGFLLGALCYANDILIGPG